MSRKNKNIEVEINETSQNKNGRTDLEVLVKNKRIGTVQKDVEDKFFTAQSNSGGERKVSTVDQAIQAIIEAYNLHDL